MNEYVKLMREEVRVMQIKNILRTYYIVNDANSFSVGDRNNTISADQALEALLYSLMTEEEVYHFFDCNEFQGEHWVDMVKDYLEIKEEYEEEEKEKERNIAIDVAAKEGLRDVTETFEHWMDGKRGWLVYGTMYGLDPSTYDNGCSPMVVRVVNGKIDLVDGQ